jgi:hypothetical protein
VQEVLSVSERRACRAIGQARSSHGCQAEKPDQDRPLRDRMVVLARENPRHGYRRIWALLRSSGATSLRREDWQVNRKWEDADSETFNSLFENESLNRELFSNPTEAKVLAEEYRPNCNNDWLHSSLEYRTPAEFARGWQLGTLAIEVPGRETSAWSSSPESHNS